MNDEDYRDQYGVSPPVFVFIDVGVHCTAKRLGFTSYLTTKKKEISAVNSIILWGFVGG
jgi:hypothetical protein